MSLLLLISQSEISTPVIVSAVSAWNTRVAVAQTQDTDWHVRGAVTKTPDTTWHVRSAVSTKTQDTAWHTREAISLAELLSDWHVQAAVSATLDTAWDVLAPPVGVFVTHTTAWHVRSDLSKDFPHAWNVRTVVPTKTAITEWKVQTAVLKTQLIRWHTRQAISLSLDSEWGQYEYERDRLTYTFQPVQPSRVQYQHSFSSREAVG